MKINPLDENETREIRLDRAHAAARFEKPDCTLRDINYADSVDPEYVIRADIMQNLTALGYRDQVKIAAYRKYGKKSTNSKSFLEMTITADGSTAILLFSREERDAFIESLLAAKEFSDYKSNKQEEV